MRQRPSARTFGARAHKKPNALVLAASSLGIGARKLASTPSSDGASVTSLTFRARRTRETAPVEVSQTRVCCGSRPQAEQRRPRLSTSHAPGCGRRSTRQHTALDCSRTSKLSRWFAERVGRLHGSHWTRRHCSGVLANSGLRCPGLAAKPARGCALGAPKVG